MSVDPSFPSQSFGGEESKLPIGAKFSRLGDRLRLRSIFLDPLIALDPPWRAGFRRSLIRFARNIFDDAASLSPVHNFVVPTAIRQLLYGRGYWSTEKAFRQKVSPQNLARLK